MRPLPGYATPARARIRLLRAALAVTAPPLLFTPLAGLGFALPPLCRTALAVFGACAAFYGAMAVFASHDVADGDDCRTATLLLLAASAALTLLAAAGG
jgi:hypothetical protein